MSISIGPRLATRDHNQANSVASAQNNSDAIRACVADCASIRFKASNVPMPKTMWAT